MTRTKPCLAWQGGRGAPRHDRDPLSCRVFERTLRSALVGEMKGQAVDLIDKVTNPLLRRSINRRSGEYVGNKLVELVRADLRRRMVIGVGITAGGIGAVGSAFFLP